MEITTLKSFEEFLHIYYENMLENAAQLKFFLYLLSMQNKEGKDCPKCLEFLSLDHFYWRPDRNTYSSWCIQCQKDRSHRQYLKGKDVHDSTYWLIPQDPGSFRTEEDRENTRKFLTSINWKYNDIYHCWTKKGLVEIINGHRTWLNIEEQHKKPKAHFIKSPEKKDLIKLSKKHRTVERPDYETLKKQISELGYRAVGRMYGKSDNSIRKWLRFYEKLYDI